MLLTLSGKVVVAAVLSSLTTALASYWWYQRRLELELVDLQRRRQEERTGRVRAEVKLRTTLKEMERLKISSAGDFDTKGACMILRSIGTVVSPYTKRMGTPRQPQLVPSSRGFIEFTVPGASLLGIDDYSHIWVIFEFHANTDLTNSTTGGGKRTKIRPPCGGGGKVGQLATRSPHRPNAIGLSLIQVDKWDEKNRRLHITGLDLVHGTPVYDVKPCVPWDIPGFQQGSPVLKVPSWVSQKDEIASVVFTDAASSQLQEMVSAGRLAPLYTTDSDGYTCALQTLREVLAQDPRSSHKGLKTNARGTVSQDQVVANGTTDEKAKGYRLVFGQCQVEFVVLEQGVEVTEVSSVDFDPDSYVDGVPLILESQTPSR